VVAVRLADLLAGLSRLADLGFGLQTGAALRSCALATRLARSLDLPGPQVQAAFYTALLHHVGCAGYAHETAQLFGDDLQANQAAGRTDAGSPRDVLATFLPALTRGKPPLERIRIAAVAAVRGGGWGDRFTATACELGRDSARRLDLPAEVQDGLFHVYDMWRGRRRPEELEGEDIPVAARIARLTGIAVLFEELGGTRLAAEAVRRRSGGMLDPGLVSRFAPVADAWFGELAVGDVRAMVLDLEPEPLVEVPDLRPVAALFGDLADLKSPGFLGHARGVAALATPAAEKLGLPRTVVADVELAALLHDVGRVAVSDAVWEKSGRLTEAEWEQVRLHAYHSERILAASAELGRLAPLVGRHHERLDGSGYHRGSRAADLSLASRVLAAADTYQALTQERPHRPALERHDAERMVLDEAAGGRLDEQAVHAVLAAAGHQTRTVRPQRRMQLSARELEVLDLVARGCSNVEIANRLVVSRRTAEHHVQHIYTKIGVSSRAAAALFAVEHGLLGDDG
jgi:HD-GYP domain-containing protein (c-di-GMP phosphodiesterase class II)